MNSVLLLGSSSFTNSLRSQVRGLTSLRITSTETPSEAITIVDQLSPDIVIGDMGGKLKSAGRYIQYPHKGHAGHHTIASWWLTLLQAAGKPQDGFGMKDKNVDPECQRGPLKELLA